MNSFEYILTTDDQNRNAEKSLRQRIHAMPCADDCGKGEAPFATIPRDYLHCNFILHVARSFETSSRIWCVSFIGNDGEVLDNRLAKMIWITFDAMNSLLTHTLKKKKYVFDSSVKKK